MIKIRIDDKEYNVAEGTKILEIARSGGINIPTLCHRDGVEHYTSCMVCMVRDRRNGSFIPSCSAPAQDGMDIETQCEEVITLRRKSVELLLSEHRADCEAPCRVVCPAGYNIPLLNRLISEVEIETALKYAEKEHKGIKPYCYKCPGFCENACRRKKIDIPVSIKNLNIWMYKKIHPEARGADETEIEKPARGSRKFSSMAGKLEWAELHEWIKESREKTGRHISITINSTAVEEAGSCMHCDCRAAGDCRLRDISEELRVKDPRGKLVYSPAEKKINRASNLIFENAKCIKCGLCIRVCEDSDTEPALCFLNRGFVTILSEPLTYGFEETLITKARQVIEVCPTGALSYFRNNPKDEINTDSSDTK